MCFFNLFLAHIFQGYVVHIVLTKLFFVGSLNLNGTNFTPNWPASCPWVTVVGGTQVKPSAATSNSSTVSGSDSGSQFEEVWNQDLTSGFFESSGGGFSNRFPSPAYQHSAVQEYLRVLGNDGKGKFNVHGVSCFCRNEKKNFY